MQRKKKPSELMKQMGSRTGQFDPEPPDQWLYVLRHGRGEDQALAWVKSKTVAIGHDSAYAIDEDTRKPLKVDAMATDLGWALQTGKNVLCTLHAQGRVRVDEHGRIWLCADVPIAHAETGTETARENDQLDNWEYFVQSTFSGYLADSIRGLPAHLHASFQTKYSAFAKIRPAVFAEAAAAARVITERYEDTIFSEFGIERRKLEKRRPAEAKFLKLELLEGLNSVQSLNGHANGDFVQSAENGLYKAETGSVQSGASLLVPDPDPDSNKRGRQAGSKVVVDKPTAARQPASPPPKSSKKSGKRKAVAPDDLVVALVNRGFPHADFDVIREILGKASVPLEFYFVKIVDPRLERARRNHESIGPGLLVELAKDAVKAYGNVAATRAAGY